MIDFRSIEDCLLDLHIQEIQKVERPPVPAGSAWSSHLNPCSNLLRLLCLHRTRQNPKSPVSNNHKVQYYITLVRPVGQLFCPTPGQNIRDLGPVASLISEMHRNIKFRHPRITRRPCRMSKITELRPNSTRLFAFSAHISSRPRAPPRE